MYPYRRKGKEDYTHTHTHTYTNDGTGRNLKTLSLKIGVMWPQTKECQQLPEAGGGKEQILPEPPKGLWFNETHFSLLASRI